MIFLPRSIRMVLFKKPKVLSHARVAILLIRIVSKAPLFSKSIIVNLLVEKSILLRFYLRHHRLLKVLSLHMVIQKVFDYRILIQKK